MAEATFKVPEIRAEEPLERASNDCRTVGSACTRTESEEEETTGRDPNKERSEALTRHAVCWGRRIHRCVFNAGRYPPSHRKKTRQRGFLSHEGRLSDFRFHLDLDQRLDSRSRMIGGWSLPPYWW